MEYLSKIVEVVGATNVVLIVAAAAIVWVVASAANLAISTEKNLRRR